MLILVLIKLQKNIQKGIVRWKMHMDTAFSPGHKPTAICHGQMPIYYPQQNTWGQTVKALIKK